MCIAAAIVGGAGISAGGSIIAGNKAAKGAKSAASTQQQQFDQTRADYAPYRQIGNEALNQYAALYGISPYTAPQSQASAPQSLYSKLTGQVTTQPVQASQQSAPQSTGTPDYSRFYNSPDYQFNLSENLKAVENSASARGGLYSGNAMRALQDRGAGVASQQYGNYANRLAALAGIGQTATGQLGQLGAQYAGNMGNAMTSASNARASGIAGATDAIGQGIGGLAGLYGYRQAAGNAGGYGGYSAGAFAPNAGSTYFPNPFGG